jgi:hypothetical protein
MTRMREARTENENDKGVALILALVIVAVVAVTVSAIAMYASTNLRQVPEAEARMRRQTAVDNALRYAVDQIRMGNTSCLIDPANPTVALPPISLDGVEVEVTCEIVDGEPAEAHRWAIVLTGEGADPVSARLTPSAIDANAFAFERIDGAVFVVPADDPSASVDRVNQTSVRNNPLFVNDDDCTSPSAPVLDDLTVQPAGVFGSLCVQSPWWVVAPTPHVPTELSSSDFPIRYGHVSLADNPASGSFVDVGSCRVFSPGRYMTVPDVPVLSAAYFTSGNYLFDLSDAPLPVIWIRDGMTVTAGTPNPDNWDPGTPEGVRTSNLLPNPDCQAAQNTDAALAGVVGHGAAFYMANTSRLRVEGSFEIHARTVVDPANPNRRSYVSIQALCAPTDGDESCTSTATDSNGVIAHAPPGDLPYLTVGGG